MSVFKKISLSFFLVLFFANGLMAANSPPDPMIMLRVISDNMLISLKKERPRLKKNPTLVYNMVNKILVPHADVLGMSRSVLGREAWMSATPAQQQAFANAFKDVVIRTYASALNAYTDETIVFEPIRGGYLNSNRIEVQSRILRDEGPPIPVSYRLALKNNQWVLYDLSVEGISLLQSFRAQLSSELSQGKSVAQITKDLQTRNIKR